jgi:AcrR family transcriptional regulator
MTPRPYRLGKRHATVQDTRERIIDGASELFAQDAFFRVSLEDVAHRAGVARATVYYQFESKFGLLDAVIAAMVDRTGRTRTQRAREHPNAALAVRLYVKEVVAFLAQEEPLLRNIYGLAAIETETGRVIGRWDLLRKELLAWLVKRLSDQGRLRSGVSQQQAVDVLWMLTSFRSFAQLHMHSGLSVRATGAVLSDLAADAVISPDAAPEPPAPEPPAPSA